AALSLCDGLILSGGQDVNPLCYNQSLTKPSAKSVRNATLLTLICTGSQRKRHAGAWYLQRLADHCGRRGRYSLPGSLAGRDFSQAFPGAQSGDAKPPYPCRGRK
ncbi:gamma-glutamyl-gamma-aminobutyrate hydrolase family protein, partial [Clostridiaceae bacterium 68-1-5]|nr:gamma-glutamyl-gamma-aminobutyrate hydrolase family protein [Suipraeoptans intestinalis]